MTDPVEYLPAGPLVPASHGNLDTIADSERRALRPIGMTAREAATRTGALLHALFPLPGVRIFQGVRTLAADAPRIPHVITAGHRLVLVESVAWPPGHYATTAAGRIHCDGVFIGQSIGPLLAAVRHWRDALPRGHRVSALVVVHPAPEGELTLPAATGRDLAWTRDSDAVRDIRAHLARARQATSARVVAALIAATTQNEDR